MDTITIHKNTYAEKVFYNYWKEGELKIYTQMIDILRIFTAFFIINFFYKELISILLLISLLMSHSATHKALQSLTPVSIFLRSTIPLLKFYKKQTGIHSPCPITKCTVFKLLSEMSNLNTEAERESMIIRRD